MARLCAFHQYLREMGYVFFNVIGVTIHSFQRVNYKSMISNNEYCRANNEYCRGDFHPLRRRAHDVARSRSNFGVVLGAMRHWSKNEKETLVLRSNSFDFPSSFQSMGARHHFVQRQFLSISSPTTSIAPKSCKI